MIKILRTITVQKRSEDTAEIVESQMVEDAKCILNSENISFSYESELIRQVNFFSVNFQLNLKLINCISDYLLTVRFLSYIES